MNTIRMYAAVTAALFVLLFSDTVHANTICFPQVAVGGGYSTTFTLMNTGASPLSGTLLVLNQNGTPRAGVPASFSVVSIPAGGSVRLTLPDTGGSPVSGSAFFQTAGTVQGVATFDVRAGGRLTTTAGVLGIEAGSRLLVPLDTSASSNTGVAVMNASPLSTTVTLRLISEGGVQLASVSPAELNPFGAYRQIAVFADTLFPGQNLTNFKGTLVMEGAAGALFAATGITVKEDLLSALPVISSFVSPGGGTPPPTGSGSVGVRIAYSIGGTTAIITFPNGTTSTGTTGLFTANLDPGDYELTVQMTGPGAVGLGFLGGFGPNSQPTSGGVLASSITSTGSSAVVQNTTCGIALANTTGTSTLKVLFTVTSSNTNSCRS